ncbi:MAG: glycosyltransferase [Candidatus Doudnabacteria bacterium]
MKIALVHEFLNQLGGAERVLQNFLEIWPEAEVHVILYDREKTQGQFEGYKKKVSWLNTLPGVKKHPRLFLPLMPGAIESFSFDDYDLVLSDSSSFAKGIHTDKLHICYCHAPTRYLWTVREYIDKQKYPRFLKFLGKIYLKRLRKWDLKAAQRADFFIANSVNIQDHIKKFYQRESIVIPPPVDTEVFFPDGPKQDYFFTASRLELYKRVDVIIEAFNHLGWPLKIAGRGTDLNRLKALAKPNVQFVGAVSDADLSKLYSQAKAFVFAAEEDAGIMVVEAQACGTPVIAFGKGGVLETVKQGITGEFFDEQTAGSLEKVLKDFNPANYDPQVIREHAEKYDKKIFQEKIRSFVEEKYGEFARSKATKQSNQ